MEEPRMLPRRTALAAALTPALAGSQPLRAATPRPPVVVELFTSQSCSSCPPADAVLAELAQAREEEALLPLSFHITYWDRLGWRDPFSMPEATERQRRYAGFLRSATIYTPQAVIQGAAHVVGSDRRALAAAIAAARPAAARGPAIGLAAGPAGGLALSLGAGEGTGTLWLIGYDARHSNAVRGGENSGRRLTHANVVRAIAAAGEWRGAAGRIDLPRPAAGEHAAVLLQAPGGAILAAATLPGALPTG